MSDTDLEAALDYCLTNEARAKARQCAARAAEGLHALRQEFLAELRRWDGALKRTAHE